MLKRIRSLNKNQKMLFTIFIVLLIAFVISAFEYTRAFYNRSVRLPVAQEKPQTQTVNTASVSLPKAVLASVPVPPGSTPPVDNQHAKATQNTSDNQDRPQACEQKSHSKHDKFTCHTKNTEND